ncbi:histone deacetylase [Achlya hypogyna]|uniref:Histone deacetylase n=1 Tax=Achlya hypogyna TaxID=1202772 RepID=A0A1V9YJ70_ACHHY|nr:histone deacetylase [Achlya hypogyna]
MADDGHHSDSGDSSYGEYSVHDSVERGDLKALEQALADDDEAFFAALREPDDMGNTPLHTAVLHPTDAMLEYLWSFGHERLSVDALCNGVPLLHLCLRMSTFAEHRSRMLAFLETLTTDAGFMADNRVLEKDDMGNTVFHLAAASNAPEAIDLFQQAFAAAGLDDDAFRSVLDAKNRAGDRVLHIAAKYHSAAAASRLVALHADSLATNSYGQTPYHVAAALRDAATLDALSPAAPWRALACTDGLGRTPATVFDGHNTPPLATSTFLYHPDALEHLPLAGHTRGGPEPPPENFERMRTLVTPGLGILRTAPFAGVAWAHDLPVADSADVLRVHEVAYVEKLKRMCAEIPPLAPEELAQCCIDPDTAMSRRSYEAAVRAAGVVCAAVDKVVGGEARNAFCVVRPPGHHAGPVGKVVCEHDPVGSQGFCLLNNVAIGAAYARSHLKHAGVHRIAILDFDVHHGNGTEECLKQLKPRTRTFELETPYGRGTQTVHMYKPWRNDADADNVFFCSVHGYGKKDPKRELDPAFHKAWFYPGSGATNAPDCASDEPPEEDRDEYPLLWNVGLPYQKGHQARHEWRRVFRTKVLPQVVAFKPDLIFLSAGFDGHKAELVNWGYLGLLEHDYEWLTQAVVKVANAVCGGRVVSVLEGGYNFHGRVASAFARSVAAHARALVDGARSDEPWSDAEMAHEMACEDSLILEAAQKKARAAFRKSLDAKTAADDSKPSEEAVAVPVRATKRARKEVDYVALAAQIASEK